MSMLNAAVFWPFAVLNTMLRIRSATLPVMAWADCVIALMPIAAPPTFRNVVNTLWARECCGNPSVPSTDTGSQLSLNTKGGSTTCECATPNAMSNDVVIRDLRSRRTRRRIPAPGRMFRHIPMHNPMTADVVMSHDWIAANRIDLAGDPVPVVDRGSLWVASS
jgi:hypothetical protein